MKYFIGNVKKLEEDKLANTWKEFVVKILYNADHHYGSGGGVQTKYKGYVDLSKFCTPKFKKRLIKALMETEE